MSDISTLLRQAMSDEPPYAVDPDFFVTAARRLQRRRVVLTTTAAIATLTVGAGSVLAISSDSTPRTDRSTVVPATPAATSAAPEPRVTARSPPRTWRT